MNSGAENTWSRSTSAEVTDFEILSSVRTVIRQEADGLNCLLSSVPLEFVDAVRMIDECEGSVLVTGIGKAGWIGQKISASFASTGTKSHFLHAAEAIHGDLGRVDQGDVVVVLSNSGETEEIIRLLGSIRKNGAKLIGVTGSQTSTLGKYCDCTIAYGKVSEACSNNLAPSVSTTMMLAIGDALALTVSGLKGFSSMDFARFHPGGSLGQRLKTVDQAMRPLSQCRTTDSNTSVRESISQQARQGRRTGALLVIDANNRLEGIFTDSDLVRLLERRQDQSLDQPVKDLMTSNPIHVLSGQLVSEAIEVLSENCISELPVVDSTGRVVGLIDITDVIS